MKVECFISRSACDAGDLKSVNAKHVRCYFKLENLIDVPSQKEAKEKGFARIYVLKEGLCLQVFFSNIDSVLNGSLRLPLCVDFVSGCVCEVFQWRHFLDH